MSEVYHWIRQQSATLDNLIAEAAKNAFLSHPKWGQFELDESLDDLHQLGKGSDCCYDRPSIGPTYALWYHGRRVHDALRLLADPFLGFRQSELSVLDLGSGTGATIWALGLLAIGAKRTGVAAVPHVQVHAIDASPFMLEHAEQLWNEFKKQYPEIQQLQSVTFHCENWVHFSGSCPQRPWVIAAYLLDHSDQHRISEVSQSILLVAEKHSASRLFLATTISKGDLLLKTAPVFPAERWEQNDRSLLSRPFWEGPMVRSQEIRRAVYESRDLPSRFRWARPPTWESEIAAKSSLELHSRIPIQADLFFSFSPQTVLDEIQDKAAEPDDRKTFIFGAAGSGKSHVLVERIARVVRRAGNSTRLRILVTAFNRLMIDQLAIWLQPKLPEKWQVFAKHDGQEDFNEKGCGFWEIHNHEDKSNFITMVNTDRLPTKVVGLTGIGNVQVGKALERSLNDAIKYIRRERGLKIDQYADILTPSFIEAELHRVVYGQLAFDRPLYVDQKPNRKGRLRRLSQPQRAIVFDILEKIGCNTLTHRRIKALQKLREGNAGGLFTHVFVDECQDFTLADFEMFWGLADERKQIVVAGDLAQSMRVGASYHRPDRRRWKTHRLNGSYRLPLRICECVRPLAEEIAASHRKSREDSLADEGLSLPAPKKAAVLGVRPVVVEADSPPQMAQVVREVFECYAKGLELDRITIVERDPELQVAIRSLVGAHLHVESQSMNKIKGLERSCIVWSTRIRFPENEAVKEWAYTIMTRSSGLLVLVIGRKTRNEFKSLINRLRQDRLLYWSRKAKELVKSYSS